MVAKFAKFVANTAASTGSVGAVKKLTAAVIDGYVYASISKRLKISHYLDL